MIRTAVILSKYLSGRVNRDYFHVCLFFISHDSQSDKMNTELWFFSFAASYHSPLFKGFHVFNLLDSPLNE